MILVEGARSTKKRHNGARWR